VTKTAVVVQLAFSPVHHIRCIGYHSHCVTLSDLSVFCFVIFTNIILWRLSICLRPFNYLDSRISCACTKPLIGCLQWLTATVCRDDYLHWDPGGEFIWPFLPTVAA